MTVEGYDQIPCASDWICRQNMAETVCLCLEEGLVDEHLLGFDACPMQATVDLNYYTLLNNANRMKFSREMFEDDSIQASAVAGGLAFFGNTKGGAAVEEEIG